MAKAIAYIRASTDKQDLNNQKLEIFEFAKKNKLEVDDFIQMTMSSRKTSKERRIDEMLSVLNDADTLIVTELSRLGRSTAEVIGLVNELIKKQVRVIAIKQNLDMKQHDMNSKIMITLFSLFAELERDLISLRTKEALASKKMQGIQLGKPKGTIQKSKFDKDHDKIKELLALGLSVRKIAIFLGYSNHIGLNTYIRKREVRKALME
ncbi:TPA: recombinase family protein [Legionella pneumophila]|jgi:DNA invertase Pin-like site-specific DNA recombinase|uniref:Recombinase family protein n=1 Tax=Legionella pneumophila TaxID=446 RepID=A0AAP3HHL6_LEGPN|nr:recombinase family protein [Legionella pneumophila]MCZ4692034.1 recombinase family protein [Legionella pneumophila]MCZ4709385.1 recombinase family protein [Legionella pneumophila]MCZ4720997.1 recombinase family protein [Legionella pneumophila]WBA07496.1 DNA-invertase hin [Legionella pneumophila]HCE5384995.1 recombinase family protein [Legionella pneumophila]